MKNLLPIIFFAVVLNLISSVSHAGVEIRGHAGIIFNEPSDLNNALKVNGAKELNILPNFGGDFVITPGGFPLGIGLRYDTGSIQVDGVATGTQSQGKVSTNRLAALVQFELFEKVFPLTLVLTGGLYHTIDIEMTSLTGTRTKYDSGKALSFTAGIMNGYTIGPVKLMGEAGAEYYVYENISGPSGNANFKVNLNGIYVLGHLGFAF
jgi:hypothetical protein